MKISIRTKILTTIGTLYYGSPKSFGVNCSATEFYGLSNERPIENNIDFHPANAGRWATLRRNGRIDEARRIVFKHICITATVLSIAIYTSGTLLTSGIIKAKQVGNEVRLNINKNLDTKKRISEIEDEAKRLTKLAQEGIISKAEYETKANRLKEEYKHLKEQQ